MKYSLQAAFFSLVLLGSISAGHAQTRLNKPKIETIHGFLVTYEQLTFTVNNNGYTAKSSFRLDIQEKPGWTEVTLVRLISDEGKALLDPADIIFSRTELTNRMKYARPIKVMNPFSFTRW